LTPPTLSERPVSNTLPISAVRSERAATSKLIFVPPRCREPFPHRGHGQQ
jgi:hypothetical protein